MKKNLVIAFLLGAIGASFAMAQVGYDLVAIIAKGSYPATTAFSVGTAANVAIVPANGKRADITCRNNSSFTLYIGTNAAGTSLTGVGFPVLANESFELGAMSGEVYGIGSGGTVDVRCLEGAIR